MKQKHNKTQTKINKSLQKQKEALINNNTKISTIQLSHSIYK